MSLPGVETALATMLAGVRPLDSETVDLSDADGRWLADDIVARHDQPPFDASSMDGWTMRADDAVPGRELVIMGESAAGLGFAGTVLTGQAVRISTGAPLPSGGDVVVMQEDATRDGDRLALAEYLSPVVIRRRGCDFAIGQRLLDAGRRMTPWTLALAASAGCGSLSCGRQPRVTILTSGNELVSPGHPLRPDQIYDSGSAALAAFVGRHGGIVLPPVRVGDSEDAIVEAMRHTPFDLLVTMGGASVGDHDRVKPALRRLGARLSVEGVAVRPGKPVWFATLPDGSAVLGLPGNPASALVCAELFLAPLLAAFQGGQSGDRFEAMRLDAPVPANGPREHYMRAQAGPGLDGIRRVTPFADQDSSMVTVMAAANALIRRPPHAPAVGIGEVVPVLASTL